MNKCFVLSIGQIDVEKSNGKLTVGVTELHIGVEREHDRVGD